MLAHAAPFVTPLSLVAPKCGTCNDSGEIADASSFLDGLPCSCQDGLYNLQQFNKLVAQHMSVALAPVDDTRWPDDVHTAYFGEGV